MLIIKNKEILIRYLNTSFSAVIFRNGKTEKLCKSFIDYCHCHRRRPVVVVVVGIPELLSELLLLASLCCCCLVAVGSSVPSCDFIRWLLRLVAGGVLLLSSAVASPLSKLTYPFVHKFQQVIGTNKRIFERV